MKKLLFFVIAIIFAIQGWAQIVTIGTGTTGKYDMPINTFYNYSYTQQIFDSIEIGAQVGVINSLSFQYFYGTTQVKDPVTIYIGNTTKLLFSSSTDWVPISSMVEVFSGSVNFTNTATGNWVNVIFDTPFIWDGTSNIVVAVLNNHGSYSTSSNNTFYTHTTTGNKGLCYQVDTSPINPSTTSYTGTLRAYRANIQLKFGSVPTCLNPGSLSYTNLTDNSVDISWIKKGTAQIWDVEYKLNSDTNWLNATTTIVTDSTVSLTNLLPDTNYDFRVRSNCGVGDVSLWRTGNFKTLCSPTITLPLSENFDNLGGTGSAYFPSCWSKITTYSTYPYPSAANYSSPYSLYFYATTGNYNLAILNAIDQSININTLRTYFKMRKGSAASELVVGVMTDPNDPTTFMPVDTVSPSATVVWEDFEVSFSSYTGTGRFLAFYSNAVSATNYFYIDDIVVDYIPACAKPSNLIFSNITTTGVDISWTPGNSTDFAWWVYYKKNGDAVYDSVYTLTNSISLTNLLTNTAYDIQIKTDCSVELSEPSFLVQFRTACGAISSFPWTESFDSYGGTGSAYYPACWNKVTTYSSYPYLSPTNYSAPSSLYFYATSGNYNIAILPAIDASVQVNSLSLFMKIYKGNAANNMVIGIMSDSININSFDTIAVVSPQSTGTWETFHVPFTNYTGTGQYIAFKVEGTGVSNIIYLDDVELYVTPPCAIPIGLTDIDSLATLNSITLDWDGTDDMNVLSWIVDYKLINDTVWQSVDALAHPFSLTGLQSSVVYQVRLAAICSASGDTTYASNSINIEMECGTISTFPWTEGFEESWYVAYGLNTGTHPWCWTNIDGGASQSYDWRKTTTSTYVRSGSGALQMYAANTTGSLGDWIISPVFTFTGNERLQFWAKNYSTYTDDFSVQIFDVTTNGVVDAESDTSLFTVIMPTTIVPSSSVWTQFEISLSQFIGDYQIAFVRNTTGGYYLNIDDISVSPLPQCARPTTVNFTNILANSADITWIPANTTDFAWWVYYKQTSASTWDSVYTTTYPITINNLTPNTQYDVEVRTDCGGLISNPSIPASFTTLCLTIDGVTSLPWTEGFEGITATNELPACWSATRLGSYTYTQTSDYSSYNRQARTGSKSAYFRYGCNDKFTTSIFELYAGQSYAFKFWYITDGLSGWQNLQARVVSVNDTTVNQIIGSPVVNANNTTYQMYLGSFNAPTTGLYEFSIECLSNGSSWYLTIDDLSLEVSNCPIPDNLTFSNITPTGADLTWGMGTATQWQVEHKLSTDTVWTKNLVVTNNYTFNNLLPQTSYDFRVASICGVDTSMFMPVNLITPCTDIISLPHTENFDNLGGTGANYFPQCWNKITTYSTYPYPSSTNHSSPYSLYFYTSSGSYNLAILNAIDPSISIDSLRVSFYLRKGNATSEMVVGIMSDRNDPTTFVGIDTVSPSATTIWENFEVSFANYTGTGRHIAFKVEYNTTTNSLYFDDVVVDYIPSCPKPVQLSVSNITTTSVDINWLAGGSNTTSWWLYWKEASATDYDSVYVSNVNTYTINNLLPSLAYEYYMKADCSVELSEPTNVYLFRTACGIITTLPWSENFDTFGGTGSSYFPPCWNKITTYSTYPYLSTTNYTSPASLYFYATSGTYNIATTPQFDVTLPVNTLQASFLLRKTSAAYNLIVGVMSDPTIESTFVPIDTVTPSATLVWEPFDVSFGSYVGTGVYIAFKCEGPSSTNSIYLDDLQIYPIPSCTRPNKPVVTNPTFTSLDVAWTDPNPNNTLYKVYYRLLGDTTWSVINNATSPTTLTGLASTSGYEIAVATDCTTEESMLSYITIGRTACGTVTALPFADNFDTYGTGTSIMPDCWVRNTSYALRPYVNTGGFSGNCLYFYSGTAGTYAMAITPPFDPSIQLNTLKINLKFRSSSATADTLRIGVMTDTSYASFVEVAQVFGPTTWNDYQVDLSSYTGTGTFIGFMVKYGTTYAYSYVDDLVISANVICNAPTNVVANNIATTSADISWTAGGSETGWQIREGLSGAIVNLVNTQYQVTGLTPNTAYTFYVRSDCGSGAFSAWVAVNFTT
ncbi:MAG: fibronectin type III domain-containing protein, partial [Bacteroidales bacterium]